jgi:phosphonate transport system permease protein
MPARLALLIGTRRAALAAFLVLGVLCAWHLRLGLGELFPSPAGWRVAGEFFQAALSPALTYEDAPPAGTAPLLHKVLAAVWHTAAFAAAAVGLALVAGIPLGFLSSSAWWEEDPAGRDATLVVRAARLVAPLLVWSARTFIALMRSVHELLWAVLFMSALGLNALTAVLAIAIPYAGVFAKVFSEIIDETPRDAAHALRASGAPATHVFLAGLLPRALPDTIAYACYRLECGMRSSAVMGFFGIPTLGYYLAPAFDEQHYREVWTYLYALILLLVLMDAWSGAMRRRLLG